MDAMDAMRPHSFSRASLRLNREPGEQNGPAQDGEHPPSGQDDIYQETSKNVLDLDLDEELLEGDRQQEELLGRFPIEHDPETLERLQALYQKLHPLIQRSDLVYDFFALQSETPFASSCCNGAVFFSRCLLESLDDQQTLYIGAHELVHTEFRHFASRGRRLEDLRRAIPAAPLSSARQRLEMASVLAVRHLEEFEADHVSALWLGYDLAVSTLTRLHQCCRQVAPDALRRPTHPSFESRTARLANQDPPPDPIKYLWSLVEG